MPALRATLITTLACASALLAPRERAHACSLPAPLPFELVASSQPSGPIVFIQRCAIECPALPSLQIKNSFTGTGVVGSFATKGVIGSRDQLVLFTPGAPLPANVTYALSAVGRPALTFTIEPAGASAPLEHAELREGTTTSGAGRFYECSLGLEPFGCGVPQPTRDRRLSWNALGFVRSNFSVAARASADWLFSSGDARWAKSLETTVDLSPGEERCVNLEAWNVLTDAREARRLCRTGPALTDAQQNVVLPTPNLGACREPPTLGHEVAAALLDSWCRDRSEYCATHTSGPEACGSPDPRCAQADASTDSQEEEDEWAADDERDESETPATTQTSAAPTVAEHGHAFGAPPPEDRGAGCALARSGARVGDLALLGLLAALALARRALRVRAEDA